MNQKPTGTATSVPVGIVWGLLAAIVVTTTGSCIAAKLINEQILGWSDSGYAVMIILILSSWTGAMVASGKIKRQRIVICLVSGAAYFGMLLIMTALFFGGQYSGVGETALLILCGSMLGVFTECREKKGRKQRKTRYRHR